MELVGSIAGDVVSVAVLLFVISMVYNIGAGIFGWKTLDPIDIIMQAWDAIKGEKP